jgi:predicted translin family RNA/ssDNA-binding protein
MDVNKSIQENLKKLSRGLMQPSYSIAFEAHKSLYEMAEVDIITLMMSIQAVNEQIKKYEALLTSESLGDPEEIQSLILSYEKASVVLKSAYMAEWHQGSNLPNYFELVK